MCPEWRTIVCSKSCDQEGNLDLQPELEGGDSSGLPKAGAVLVPLVLVDGVWSIDGDVISVAASLPAMSASLSLDAYQVIFVNLPAFKLHLMITSSHQAEHTNSPCVGFKGNGGTSNILKDVLERDVTWKIDLVAFCDRRGCLQESYIEL